jgi:hypothetical protein
LISRLPSLVNGSFPSQVADLTALLLEASQCPLERVDQAGEVLVGCTAQEADEGVDAFFFVVAEDLGDVALDGVLEGEEQSAELAGADVEQVVGADQAAGVDGELDAGHRQCRHQPES